MITYKKDGSILPINYPENFWKNAVANKWTVNVKFLDENKKVFKDNNDKDDKEIEISEDFLQEKIQTQKKPAQRIQRKIRKKINELNEPTPVSQPQKRSFPPSTEIEE